MRERNLDSAMLVAGFCTLALALGMSPLAQDMMAARTDSQAQARTVWEVDKVGAAMFSWLTDQVGGVAPGQSQVPASGGAEIVDLSHYPVITHGALESLLVPQYLESLPALDGWNHSYDFRLNVAQPLAQQVMGIRSPGRDGATTGSLYTVARFNPESFDEDIVWADGFAVRSPALVLSDREAQKKTVVDIQKIGAAMFRWLTDQVEFAAPAQEPRDVKAVTVNFPDYPVITHEALTSVLVPQYIRQLPELDGWERPYDFRLDLANPLANEVMAIRSPGRDGSFEANLYLVSSFDPDHFDEDIAWADGLFVRSPGPLQGLSFFTLSPCRVFDTRPASALQSGSTNLFEIGALCGIPTSAKAVAVNVTVVSPTGAGHITLFPAGLPVPEASTLNFAAGQTRSNNAILGLTEDGIGSIKARSVVSGGGQVHLVLDVTGYFE